MNLWLALIPYSYNSKCYTQTPSTSRSFVHPVPRVTRVTQQNFKVRGQMGAHRGTTIFTGHLRRSFRKTFNCSQYINSLHIIFLLKLISNNLQSVRDQRPLFGYIRIPITPPQITRDFYSFSNFEKN